MTQKRIATRPAPGIAYDVLQSKLQALFRGVGTRGHVDSVSSARQSFSFTPQNQQALKETLAEGYTQAKSQSYARAVQTTAHLKPPVASHKPDEKHSRQWANEQATGIISTYHDALDQHLHKEKKHSTPMLLLMATLDWIRGFVKWKAPQIAKTTWYAGVSDGTRDWLSDNMDWLSDQETPLVGLQVVPGSAVCDECKQYAGNTYDVADIATLPDFPLHPNCQHSIEVITL